MTKKKEIFDLSDHCLIEGKFQVGRGGNFKCCGKEIIREFYKTNCETLKNDFIQRMEDDLLAVRNDNELVEQETIERLIIRNSNNILKRQITKRIVYENNRRREVEPVWMNDRFRKEIKLRR